MRLIYNFILRCYELGIRMAASFNGKAKLWVQGRTSVFQDLEKAMLQRGDRSLVWIHAASLGEFEQGRPVIEALKREYPDIFILLTFFSPSGYEVRKNYSLADQVSYLPIDRASNATSMINIVQPSLVLFVKYELWYHYLKELQKQHIPTLLISALFRMDQFFFQWYGQWFLPVIEGLDHIFVQNEASRECLRAHGVSRVSVAGDSRVDRVARLAASTAGRSEKDTDPRIDKKLLESFVNNHQILVAGSTWPEDEKILAPFFSAQQGNWKIIIAPHEISENRLQAIENLFAGNTIRYSTAQNADLRHADVLIIDNIGMLAYLYQFGKVAYIGGAFGKGLHNTLEPISFGIPVLFGPRYHKFEEARWLVENGGGCSVESTNSFNKIMKSFADENFYRHSANTAKKYIELNQGATKRIMEYIRTLGVI